MDGHVPAGTSVRTAAQFAQTYNSGMTKTYYYSNEILKNKHIIC
jgi:YHS domain-containing protein